MTNIQTHQSQNSVAEFEQLCSVLYGSATPQLDLKGQSGLTARQQADMTLNQLKVPGNLQQLRVILESSKNHQAQFLAATCIKEIFVNHFAKIEPADKMAFKSFLVDYLVSKGSSCNNQVLRMVIMVLTKIAKKAWICQPELQCIVLEILQLTQMTEAHSLIAFQALEDIIVEMGYLPKLADLAQNRRIAQKFRDGEQSALLCIFEATNKTIHSLVQQLRQNKGGDYQVKILLQAVTVYEKCLSYDFNQVSMNESLDDAPATSVPACWRPLTVENHAVIKDLFFLITVDLQQNEVWSRIKTVTCQSLAQLANVRLSIFESLEKKIIFVQMFIQELSLYLKQQSMFKDKRLYKESVQLVYKVQSNFQIRDLQKAGEPLLEAYLMDLFQFTLVSHQFGSQSPQIMTHANKLCLIWQRIVLEGFIHNIQCREQLDGLVTRLASSNLDALLQVCICKEEGDDEEENFEAMQRTVRCDDMDHFSKLLRHKIDHSMQMLLERFTLLIQKYEQGPTLSIEKQLTFLVQQTISLFSYGFPTSSAAISSFKRQGEQTQDSPKCYDFMLTSRMVYLCNLTNQLLAHQQKQNAELEKALLSFILQFKGTLITDSRLLLLGSHIANLNQPDDANGGDDSPVLTFAQEISSTQTSQAYTVLAQMAGYQSLEQILEIFATKFIGNLSSTAKYSETQKRIVELSLEVFQAYLGNATAQKLLSQVPIVKQIATTHVCSFRILFESPWRKQLGQFFKVLTGLWLTEDYITSFQDCLNQLSPSIEQIFSLDAGSIKQLARAEVLKIFYILRGVLQGLPNNRVFNMFFEWFHPKYMAVMIEGTLNAFHDDDEVVHICVKFLSELVNNRNNRMRFDTWNINGLVVFKESAKYIIQLFQVWDCLQFKQNTFVAKWKYIKELAQLYKNVLSGNYINFAICEYYNDDIFTQLTRSMLKMAASIDYKAMAQYAKVQQTFFSMLWALFQQQLELILTKIDFALIKAVLALINQSLVNSDSTYEVQSDSNNCINFFCEFVHDKMKRTPTVKSAYLVSFVNKFYQEHHSIFWDFLKTIVTVFLFSENKNIWIYQKSFHAALVMCAAGPQTSVQGAIMEVVNQNETDPERRQLAFTQVARFLEDLPLASLESKSRESFAPKFNTFKSFIIEFVNS